MVSNPEVPVGFFCSDVAGDEPTCPGDQDLTCCLQVAAVSLMLWSWRCNLGHTLTTDQGGAVAVDCELVSALGDD